VCCFHDVSGVAAGVVLVIAVAGGAAWVMFAVLAHKGLLRVDQVTELAGIDNMDHGEQQQQQLVPFSAAEYACRAPLLLHSKAVLVCYQGV
jgi:hypothetical protein